MSFLRNLQVKVLLSALIPGTFILIAVALIALYAYGATVRDLVEQRDAELARLTADRLRDGLDMQIRHLQAVADSPDVQSLDTDRVLPSLDVSNHDLQGFDGGVTIYGPDSRALWSGMEPSGNGMSEFPMPEVFEAARATLQPAISGVFRDSRTGNDSILISVPIVARGEFMGVVSGVATLRGPLVSAIFSELLDVAPGHEGFTYLVDGSGRSIFHDRDDLLGADLKAFAPVEDVTAGVSGADLSTSPTGEFVISGFAPVPGTDWGVVTEQLWSEVEGPIRNSSWTVLGLLVLGAALASAGIWFSTRRALRPIRDLNAGAQRIASGDFDYTIPANTGDEVQELSQQFNVMARALKESYAELEERVALRHAGVGRVRPGKRGDSRDRAGHWLVPGHQPRVRPVCRAGQAAHRFRLHRHPEPLSRARDLQLRVHIRGLRFPAVSQASSTPSGGRRPTKRTGRGSLCCSSRGPRTR